MLITRRKRWITETQTGKIQWYCPFSPTNMWKANVKTLRVSEYPLRRLTFSATPYNLSSESPFYILQRRNSNNRSCLTVWQKCDREPFKHNILKTKSIKLEAKSRNRFRFFYSVNFLSLHPKTNLPNAWTETRNE